MEEVKRPIEGKIAIMDTLSNLEAEMRDLKELLTLELLPKVSKIYARKQIFIYSLHHPQLKLKEPLFVLLESDDEQTVAYCHDLEVFGYSDTEGEALADLRETIADLYFELSENCQKLGPFPQKVWRYLSQIIEKI